MSYTIRHVSSWGTITTCLFQVYRVYFNPSCSFVSCTMSYTVIHVSLRDAITSVCIGWYVFSRYYVSISMSHVPLSSVPWCHIQSDTLHPSSSDAFSQQIRHTIHCSCEEHILFCHVLLSIRHVTSIFLRCLFTEDTARTLQCRALVIHTFFVTFFCLSHTFTSIFFRCCCTEDTVCACVLQYSALVKNTFYFVTFFCQSDTLHPSSSEAFPQEN